MARKGSTSRALNIICVRKSYFQETLVAQHVQNNARKLYNKHLLELPIILRSAMVSLAWRQPDDYWLFGIASIRKNLIFLYIILHDYRVIDYVTTQSNTHRYNTHRHAHMNTKL